MARLRALLGGQRLYVADHAAVLALPAGLLLVEVVELGPSRDRLPVVDARAPHLDLHLRMQHLAGGLGDPSCAGHICGCQQIQPETFSSCLECKPIARSQGTTGLKRGHVNRRCVACELYINWETAVVDCGRQLTAVQQGTHVVLALHALDVDVQVQLAHAADDGLPALRVVADPEGRVLPLKPAAYVRNLLSSTACHHSHRACSHESRPCQSRVVPPSLARCRTLLPPQPMCDLGLPCWDTNAEALRSLSDMKRRTC